MSLLAFPELRPACAPAETRGPSRGDVRLLVARRSNGQLSRARFDELPRFLRAGDLLVVNNSATIAAALPASVDGEEVWVHLSTPLGDGHWVVEVRSAERGRLPRPPLGTRLELPGQAWMTLLTPYRESERLTEAELVLPLSAPDYAALHGSPIRYGDRTAEWPLEAYQTVFALEPGSAEMPSAGRPFSGELVGALIARGVLVAPITLHAGVSSLERDEDPYPERYRIPPQTARLVNATRSGGGRIIAVGTTVVRALETTATVGGTVTADAGWTCEVITPERGLRCVDGLITGWHEPESSHLWMLEAAAGLELLARSYTQAAALGFSGHEFGDSLLILP